MALNLDNADWHDEEVGVIVSYDGTPHDKTMTWHIITVLSAAAIGEAVKCKHVTVILSDDRRLKRLNSEFLSLDEPTDVLSFSLDDSDKSSIEGEIYISLDKVKEQAGENGESPMDVLMRLTVHGFLHLCGYDHEDGDSLEHMMKIGESYISSIVEKE